MNGELPSNHDVSMAGAHLHLYNVQYEDEGTYECEALNSKGKDWHRARVSVEGRATNKVYILQLGRYKSLTCKLL
jgi:receptor-type tyrosine-protein phosphatase zeta